ncbi:MAG: hypothetical protein RBS57_08790 [Desulforhabdus sp.]|jgi:hypothetical protein|nr:hypothetical protein [Desulforhabdus sp.]
MGSPFTILFPNLKVDRLAARRWVDWTRRSCQKVEKEAGKLTRQVNVRMSGHANAKALFVKGRGDLRSSLQPLR